MSCSSSRFKDIEPLTWWDWRRGCEIYSQTSVFDLVHFEICECQQPTVGRSTLNVQNLKERTIGLSEAEVADIVF